MSLFATRRPLLRRSAKQGPDGDASPVSRLKSFSDHLGLWRKIIVDALILGTILLVAGIMVRDAIRNSVIIPEISVPQELETAGYSGRVVTSRLVDIWNQVSQNSQTTKERVGIGLDWERVDLEIPSSGISLSDATGFVLDAMGFGQRQVSGEIVQGDEGLQLDLRLTGNGVAIETVLVTSKEGIEGLLDAGGLAVVQLIDPYVLVSYAVGVYAELCGLAEDCSTLPADPEVARARSYAMDMAQYCLERVDCSNARVANTRGRLAMLEGHDDIALENYEKAWTDSLGEDDPLPRALINQATVFVFQATELSQASPQEAEALLNKAWPLLELARETKPDDLYVYIEIADLHIARAGLAMLEQSPGDARTSLELARRVLDEALSRDSGFVDAEVLRAEVQDRLSGL